MSTTTDVSLADLDLFANGAPWAVFEDLRRNSPVHWNVEPEPNSGFWSVTRYHDIVDVLRNTEVFSSQLGTANLEELDARQMEILERCHGTEWPMHCEWLDAYLRANTRGKVA